MYDNEAVETELSSLDRLVKISQAHLQGQFRTAGDGKDNTSISFEAASYNHTQEPPAFLLLQVRSTKNTNMERYLTPDKGFNISPHPHLLAFFPLSFDPRIRCKTHIYSD
jgi:hypothetical protein